jgi:hypothetical protein
MKRLHIISLLLLAFTQTEAQISKTDDIKKALETENKDTVALMHSGIFTAGINEGFLHNWAAGGEVASLTINSVLRANLTYLKHTDVWSNNLEMAYGLNYTYSNSFIPRKTDDRIDFTSKYGKRADSLKNLFFSCVFNFKSQFTKGYDYSLTGWQNKPTSDFLSPAYLTLAMGMEYRKGSNISLFLSPIAAREILADAKYTSLSPQGAFGIDSGKTSKLQFGAYFSGRYKKDINKHLLFSTRLDLYSNYLAKDTRDAANNIVKQDNPGNIQFFWDNLMVLKVYKTLSITLGLTIAYDNNFPYSKTYIDKASNTVVAKNQPAENLGWLQLSQVFAIGISYKF